MLVFMFMEFFWSQNTQITDAKVANHIVDFGVGSYLATASQLHPGNSMLLAGNVTAVTARKHYCCHLFSRVSRLMPNGLSPLPRALSVRR
jgi:hypothetical protein